MQKYVIKNYQEGFEQGQARIGREVARNWIWPYAYDQELGFKKVAEWARCEKVIA